MQILLVTGPGGAGSSTVAAATALQRAAAGSRCVLLTLRPPRADLADAVQVDVVGAHPALEQLWARHAAALAGAVRGGTAGEDVLAAHLAMARATAARAAASGRLAPAPAAAVLDALAAEGPR